MKHYETPADAYLDGYEAGSKQTIEHLRLVIGSVPKPRVREVVEMPEGYTAQKYGPTFQLFANGDAVNEGSRWSVVIRKASDADAIRAMLFEYEMAIARGEVKHR